MKKIVAVTSVALAGIGAIAMTSLASGGGFVVSASPVSASAPSPNLLVDLGWQGDFTYSVPPGIGGLFFHYPCPNGLTPDAGKFLVDFGDPAANSVHLIGEGLRTDVASHEWQWNINWFGAGAPAGSHIVFNVHCS